MSEFKIAKPNKYTNSDLFYNEFKAVLFTRGDEWFVGGVETQEQANELINKHNPEQETHA